jgi:2-C-methyl-D-erythritol 4-phosphate cytidylyltransferase
VQTPQCFKTGLIKNAFEVEYNHSFTDDATVFEDAGHEVILTEGNPENIKITLPNDLIIAESLIKNRI